MRLADVVLRRGHLSDQALIDAWSTGIHPAHLDRCDQCTARAVGMSRWLEDLQVQGRAEADDLFTDAHLTAQRGQILDRLAQLDRPSKVITFPAAAAAAIRQPFADRRVSPGWLAAAAAAGLMIGVISVELSHMLPFGTTPAPVTATATAPSVTTSPALSFDDDGFLNGGFDRPSVGVLMALDEMTPRVADLVLASNR